MNGRPLNALSAADCTATSLPGTGVLPVAIPVAGRPVLVVGGGRVAERRVSDLVQAGASVTVIAPRATPVLERMANQGNIRLLRRTFRASDADGREAAYAATDDARVNVRVARACRRRGVPVNVADRPELCSFYSMATVRRGSLVIAVGTGGASPGLAARVRREVEAVFDGRWAGFARRLGRARHEHRQALGSVERKSAPIGRDAAAASITLVGAGPGAVDLITIRGLRALQAADVVVYDRLVAPELLAEARPDAELVDVGKTPGEHSVDQHVVSALLVGFASRGLRVCRLKGGDPVVFGRGGEEAIALANAGFAVEFVPGVTSAIAAAECAGIPVTHRGVAASFTVVTGNTREGGLEPDWGALALIPGTLVILMGVARLREIAESLMAAGKAPDTPAALVRWGATDRQQTLEAVLGTISERAAAEEWKPPSVIVVGDVVPIGSVLRGVLAPCDSDTPLPGRPIRSEVQSASRVLS